MRIAPPSLLLRPRAPKDGVKLRRARKEKAGAPAMGVRPCSRGRVRLEDSENGGRGRDVKASIDFHQLLLAKNTTELHVGVESLLLTKSADQLIPRKAGKLLRQTEKLDFPNWDLFLCHDACPFPCWNIPQHEQSGTQYTRLY